MDIENICLSSKVIDIAENDMYLELSNRLCYYDDKNLNGVMLPYNGFEESAIENAKTLLNMPVQARYKKINNLDDLGSHEMYMAPDGSIEWGTESIGTHTSVEIKEDTVTTVSGDTKVLPCLFAKCRIWKRNKNMIAAIKRLYESENGLNSSWEIATSCYEFKDGIKILKEYSFLANTFLGSNVTPAYSGTSKTLALSSIQDQSISDQELLVAEALSQDIFENNFVVTNKNEAKEEKELLQKDTSIVEEASADTPVTEPVDQSNADETSEATGADNVAVDPAKMTDPETPDPDTTSEEQVDTSALTSYDLRRKVQEACRKKVDKWVWVSYLFPEEHEVWCEYDEPESELDYLRFTYSVDNDVVTVSEPEKVRLSVSVRNINTTVSEYEKTISEKDELIVKASSEINSLKSENTELSQYKEKFTKMEQEKVEAELKQKKEDLIASVVKSGQITREEIEASEELSSYVDNLDKRSLMAIVGERLSASMETDEKEETDTDKSVLTSEHVMSNLNEDDLEATEDVVSIMRKFLRN